MPNGSPGDHPITDILIHKLTVYSPEIDQLIKEILKLGGRDAIEHRLYSEYSPYSDPDLDTLEAELSELRDCLHSDAKERGWEVD